MSGAVPEFHGFSEEQWRQVVDAGYDYLASVAAAGQTTVYKQVCIEIDARASGRPIDPESPAMGSILSAIARRSLSAKGVVLPCVILAQKGQPGAGFFAFAVEVGLLEKKANSNARFEFWARQVQATYRAYGNPDAPR